MRKRTGMKVTKEGDGQSAAEMAQQAMLKRSKKGNDQMTPYYGVIGFFIAVCFFAVVFTFMNPKKKFSEMKVIDDSQILVHNG